VIRGQEGLPTDFRFSASIEQKSPFFDVKAGQIRIEEDKGEHGGENGGEERVDRLLSRLKAVQGELDSYPRLSSSQHRQIEKSRQGDNHISPHNPDLTRSWANDLPLRFHAGRESLSVKKNITIRDLKRPKERAQDKDYKQRYSISPGHRPGVSLLEHRGNDEPADQVRGTLHGEEDIRARMSSSGGNRSIRASELHSTHTPTSMSSPRNGGRARTGGELDPFIITVVFDGERVDHQVWEHMPVTQLLQDVSGIFGFHPPLSSVIMMLYGLHPTILRIGFRLSDPPIVSAGATVIVLQMGGQTYSQPTHTGPQQIGDGGGRHGMVADSRSVPQLPQGSKLLANFKLPQFNGTSRQWKAWNKSFTRYLSIHQLDYVIEEGFLDLLPYSKDAFSANKLVYYILEDSITPGTLGTKYFRLAAKWNGHQAYFCLHDAYVMSGPQTASILLSQLANLRFRSDETASGFCLRLREIFEDLEMVPGNAAITMHDTQKNRLSVDWY
jgi:hypothetical protein